jgi:hypothetical protein
MMFQNNGHILILIKNNASTIMYLQISIRNIYTSIYLAKYMGHNNTSLNHNKF